MEDVHLDALSRKFFENFQGSHSKQLLNLRHETHLTAASPEVFVFEEFKELFF